MVKSPLRQVLFLGICFAVLWGCGQGRRNVELVLPREKSWPIHGEYAHTNNITFNSAAVLDIRGVYLEIGDEANLRGSRIIYIIDDRRFIFKAAPIRPENISTETVYQWISSLDYSYAGVYQRDDLASIDFVFYRPTPAGYSFTLLSGFIDGDTVSLHDNLKTQRIAVRKMNGVRLPDVKADW